MARPINHERNKIIARLRAEGKSYRQIAHILRIDVATAFNGYKRVLEKPIDIEEKDGVELSTV